MQPTQSFVAPSIMVTPVKENVAQDYSPLDESLTISRTLININFSS